MMKFTLILFLWAGFPVLIQDEGDCHKMGKYFLHDSPKVFESYICLDEKGNIIP